MIVRAKRPPKRRLGSRPEPLDESGAAAKPAPAKAGGIGEQLDLFDEALKATVRHGGPGLGGSEAKSCAEQQAETAGQQERALTRGLMERIARSANLNQAHKRVEANRGGAGGGRVTRAG